MIPFSVSFSTGDETTPVPGNLSGVSFEKVSLSTTSGKQYTSLVIGPDNRLYATTIDGFILRFPINSNGTLDHQLRFHLFVIIAHQEVKLL